MAANLVYINSLFNFVISRQMYCKTHLRTGNFQAPGYQTQAHSTQQVSVATIATVLWPKFGQVISASLK